MQKRIYIYPLTEVVCYPTQTLMKATNLSDPSEGGGGNPAPAHRQPAF